MGVVRTRRARRGGPSPDGVSRRRNHQHKLIGGNHKATRRNDSDRVTDKPPVIGAQTATHTGGWLRKLSRSLLSGNFIFADNARGRSSLWIGARAVIWVNTSPASLLESYFGRDALEV